MVNARKGWFYQALFYRATLKSIKYSRCTNYRPDKDRLAKEKNSLRESLTREKLGLDSRLSILGILLCTPNLVEGHKLQIFLKIKIEEFFSDLKQIHNEQFTCITHCKKTEEKLDIV